jgi:hypothetical protein
MKRRAKERRQRERRARARSCSEARRIAAPPLTLEQLAWLMGCSEEETRDSLDLLDAVRFFPVAPGLLDVEAA